ncbi:zinc/iron-chelating domain-containing protein [Paraburkholderia acidicola]|uniref:Zinc/iron-chelating domain-containing protein n=1 Tax=Paraburkholderia acidicola TaxID=1912599 RepID=A0A2A4ERS9_9BURK|nr:YkgJ family cysteine cluster protein [Paraburkholderia acidicola]PCE23841.1 zinc/iron-chelating domain-containing protein [Paraburkholderia acidicola]
MNDLDFDCTMCGKCCHGLRLALTVDEARAWLQRGGRVELMCEAIPWPVEPAAENREAQYRRARSFPAASGTLPVRIAVLLVATFDGACPNLGADMRCGIYHERPLVCRIYPAEINPFVVLAPANKGCPPDAWQGTPMIRHGQLIDSEVQASIDQARAASARDVSIKAQLCAALGVEHAALANEGFVTYAPESDVLLAALDAIPDGMHDKAHDHRHTHATPWNLISNRHETVETLTSVGALAAPPATTRAYGYLGFFAATPAS